ncbi:MAG: hypothetical protein KUG79_06700 [Pseudomonadales bacterium]|nr:hypothetical protein [Pseudomonadales bacterium]
MKISISIILISEVFFLFGCSNLDVKPESTGNGENFQFDQLIKRHMTASAGVVSGSVTEENNTFKPFAQFNCSDHIESKIVQQSPPVSIDFIDADLREALIELSVITEIPIVVDDTIDGLVTANLNESTLYTALNILLASGSYSYRAMNDYILVGSSLPEGSVFTKLAITCRYKPQNISPIDIATSLTPYFQQFVRVPGNADFITITAPGNVQQQIHNHLEIFDQRPGQVLLEMSIVEVSRSALDVLGLSWEKFGLDANTLRQRKLGIGEWNGLVQERTEDIIDAFTIGLLPTRTVAEALQIMEKQGAATIKAMPGIVSLDGQKAHFSSTQTVWLPEIIGTTAPGGGKKKQISYGVDMNVIPRIANNGEVTLIISNASVSDLAQHTQGYPMLVTHEISNTVKVKHGEYLILGGLLQTKQRVQHDGLPQAKQLPFLGHLFGQKKQTNEEMEVLIMIRPRIL